MDRELLIEIGVEELPASWMPALTAQLREKLRARLAEFRLGAHEEPESFSTPRRLTARVAKIAERQEDLDETITGPPVSAAFGAGGQPTPAALGFAKKQGVPFEQLTRLQTSKGEYLAYHKRNRGRSAVDTLPALLTGLLRDLSFPKQMRWDARLDDGRGELLFGRPIRWLLFLYGGRVVPFTIGRTPGALGTQVQEIESGALTYGHRFLATSGRAGRSIKVRTFEDYQARLAEHFVVLDHSERRDRIRRELEKHARRLGGRVQMKDHAALVEEVADLVEYPGVVAGFYDRALLALPHEVLSTTLVHHQHYFPVVSDTGELKEAFLAVVNTQPQDERRIARNAERVVTARLRDARFFWESDRKTTLESRLDRLHTVLFHKKLGSYRDKAMRIEKLAEWIAKEAFGQPAEAAYAAKAARLAKADLTTDMVFEFPELQGVMGGIYAREERHPEQVWKAIYYHYLPVGVEADAPPTREELGASATAWAAVALADKLDTLVGLLSQGEKVTGSKDPYALRRAAHGIAKILVDAENLTGKKVTTSIDSFLDQMSFALTTEQRNSVLMFLADRLRHVMQVRGLEFQEIQAATGDLETVRRVSVSALWARAATLGLMKHSAEFTVLARLFKRASKILESVDLSDVPRDITKRSAATLTIEDSGVKGIDLILFDRVRQLREELGIASAAHDARSAVSNAATLRPYIDQFFDEVMVVAKDPQLRQHRLGVLLDLVHLIRTNIGDISMIVPQTE